MADVMAWDARFCDGRQSTFDAVGAFSIGAMYDAAVADGRAEVFFYDGVPVREDFIARMDAVGRWFYAWFSQDGAALGWATVSNIQGRAGMLDFCFLRAGQADRFAIARDCLGTVCGAGGLDCVFGLTPEPYRHAWRFAEACGFRRLARVPGSCRMQRHGKTFYRNGVLTMYSKESA